MGIETLVAGGAGFVIGLAMREDPLIPLIIGAIGAVVVPQLPALLGLSGLAWVTAPLAAGMASLGAGAALGVVASVVMRFKLPGFLGKIFG